MANAAREENNNPYDGGLGTGGKFRKRPIRRSHTTPYDRPPTSVRNPSLGNRNGGGERGNGGGWLSKFVDPAQRIITYSAHRLFSSVFRKRLPQAETPFQPPQPPQQLQEIEENHGTEEGDSKGSHALSLKNDMIQAEDTNASTDQNDMKINDGLTDLEHILKQKTFTRSEVDRLTMLLRSRAVDSTTTKQDQRAKEIHVKLQPSNDNDQGYLHSMAIENGNQKNIVSTPLGSSRVHDERIASPAELAKAYMGSRPSEVSPSMLGYRGQLIREDSVFPSETPFSSKPPTMSIVPRSSGQRMLPENGFATPRSHGRSAVYSMARTPYARPQSSVKRTWEESMPPGSRQVAQMSLKRRSTVIDNDMGSVGPVRRIRQKSNLMSRSLALPSTDTQHASSSYQEIRPVAIQTSRRSAEDVPGPSFNPVPSKSRETASKILQQLDKLVSSREKSPTKLSPSMLHGSALKSLENVEAPKFLENHRGKQVADSPGSSYKEEDRHKETQQVLALPEKKPVTAVFSTNKTASSPGQEACAKGTYMPDVSSLEEHPSKKRAFRMSAHEDLLDSDDDVDAAPTPTPAETKVENDISSKAKEKNPLAPSEAKPLATFVSNGAVGTGNNSASKFGTFVSESSQQDNVAADSIAQFSKVAEAEKSNTSTAVFSSVEKIDSVKEPTKAPPVFPTLFSSPVPTVSSVAQSSVASDSKTVKPSSFTFGASESLSKLPESSNTVSSSSLGTGSSSNGNVFAFGAAAASPSPNNGSHGSSTTHLFAPSSSSSQLPSTVQSFSAAPSETSVFGNLPASSTTNSPTFSLPTSAPELSATPSTFKFGESAASVATSMVSSPTNQATKETDLKDSISSGVTASTVANTVSSIFGNSSSSSGVTDTSSKNIFGGMSSAAVSATHTVSSGGNSLFGVTSSSASGMGTSSTFGMSSPPLTSSGTSLFSGTASSTGSSIFGFSASSASSSQSQSSSLFGTTNTQSSPFVFGSSSSTPSFGLSGNTSTASSGSLFGSSTSGSLVFGAGSATSSSSTTTALFGSNWQPQSSTPTFGSSSSAPAFTFGGSSSAATASTTTTTPIFGSSASSAPSSSSMFSFNSQPVFGGSGSVTQSQPPVFGGSTTGFAFGAIPTTPHTNGSPRNDQMAMEDSMAEDTFQTKASSPVVPMFGQPAVQPPQPTAGFAFGAAAAAPTPAAANPNPFQFGNQQNAASPFQANATGSVEFNGGGAGGSFSLGSTGGGGDKSGRKIIRVNRNRRQKK